MFAKRLIVMSAISVALAACTEGSDPARLKSAAGYGESLAIGTVQPLAGTNVVSIGVGVTPTDAGMSSNHPRSLPRNLILLDTRDGSSRQLLEHNAWQIDSLYFLPASATPRAKSVTKSTYNSIYPDGGDPSAPIVWYVFAAGQIDGGPRDVMFGRVDDGAPRILFPKIQRIDSLWMIDANRMAAVLHENGDLSYRIVDLATGKTVLNKPIPV